MKKQILILVFFLMAVFAGVNKSYGQTCTPSERTPAAGVEYTYSTTAAGTSPKYDWYITKSTDVLAGIIATPSTLFTVNGATPYHLPGTGVNNIKITWTQAAVADGGPFFLVLRYSETTTGTAACTVENVKIYEIKPINTFLLAFQGGTLSGANYVATPGSNACAGPIVSGTANPNADPTLGTLTMVYGQNTLYYVATASGIAGDWYPSIHIPALNSTQEYVSAGWSTDMTGSGVFTNFGAAPAVTGAQDLLSTVKTTAIVAGTPILVKIVIDNKSWQTIVDQTITVGLDGYLPPSPVNIAVNQSDITSITDCTPLAAFGRTAIYTINKRPDPIGVPVFLPVTNP